MDILQVQGRTDILQIPGRADISQIKGRTDIFQIEGSTDILQIQGRTDVLKIQGRTDVLKIEGGTDILQVQGRVIFKLSEPLKIMICRWFSRGSAAVSGLTGIPMPTEKDDHLYNMNHRSVLSSRMF